MEATTRTTPQTPRRSNRQQECPALCGSGILIPTFQMYKWPAHPIHMRPTQPSDLLPDEAFEPGETQFYSSLIRYGLPSRPIVRTYGKQKSAKGLVLERLSLQGWFWLRQDPKPTRQFPEGFFPPVTPGHALQISMSSLIRNKHILLTPLPCKDHIKQT